MTLAERLRTALSSDSFGSLVRGDQIDLSEGTCIPAAVLIAITDRPHPGVILTVRRDHLRTHAGQIAFPGGRLDAGEDGVTAALREASEELGLRPTDVDVVGAMESYRTITGYVVAPVVGVITPDLPLAPHEEEVADWFEVPLDFLLDPANRQQHSVVFEERARQYYVIEWKGRKIWGATAGMIVNLAHQLQWT